jgi:hypothetical protein
MANSSYALIYMENCSQLWNIVIIGCISKTIMHGKWKSPPVLGGTLLKPSSPSRGGATPRWGATPCQGAVVPCPQPLSCAPSLPLLLLKTLPGKALVARRRRRFPSAWPLVSSGGDRPGLLFRQCSEHGRPGSSARWRRPVVVAAMVKAGPIWAQIGPDGP